MRRRKTDARDPGDERVVPWFEEVSEITMWCDRGCPANIPDPPADHPRVAQYKFSSLHKSAVVVVISRPPVRAIFRLPLEPAICETGRFASHKLNTVAYFELPITAADGI